VTVSTFGVDYSIGPPTVQELKNAKVTFVGRYISTPGHPKNLKPAEAERLSVATTWAATVAGSPSTRPSALGNSSTTCRMESRG
jgi:hypothetical protein